MTGHPPEMTMIRRLSLICLLAIIATCLPVGPAQAQGGPLTFGQPIEAILPPGAIHAYTFCSEGQDRVSATMTTTDPALDPVLVLVDPAGALIAFNDDAAPGQRNAALVDVPLTAPGVYTLVARSYGRRGGGAYTLEASSRRAGMLAESTPIGIGETVTGEIRAAGQVDRWRFEGVAGQVISIALDAAPGSGLDPLLELLAADGSPLATSDDEGGGRNSLINGLALPYNGPYVIVVRAWGHASTGPYTLHLLEGARAPTPVPAMPTPTPSPLPEALPPVSQIGTIAPGEVVSGLLPAGTMHLWTLTVDGPLQLDVRLEGTAGALDTLLEVIGPDGVLLARDDDGSGGVSSRLPALRLPAAGVYTLRVRAYLAAGQGAYRLSVSQPGGAAGG